MWPAGFHYLLEAEICGRHLAIPPRRQTCLASDRVAPDNPADLTFCVSLAGMIERRFRSVLDRALGSAPDGIAAGHYRATSGAEVDLVLERWAIEIKSSTAPKVARGFHSACEDLAPTRRSSSMPVKTAFRCPVTSKPSPYQRWQWWSLPFRGASTTASPATFGSLTPAYSRRGPRRRPSIPFPPPGRRCRLRPCGWGAVGR